MVWILSGDARPRACSLSRDTKLLSVWIWNTGVSRSPQHPGGTARESISWESADVDEKGPASKGDWEGIASRQKGSHVSISHEEKVIQERRPAAMAAAKAMKGHCTWQREVLGPWWVKRSWSPIWWLEERHGGEGIAISTDNSLDMLCWDFSPKLGMGVSFVGKCGGEQEEEWTHTHRNRDMSRGCMSQPKELPMVKAGRIWARK